jgi:hypothetical protein
MAQPYDDEEEEPLDPVLERVQRRLRRLMLIGGLTLGLGIGAVLIAIVYRFFIADTSTGSQAPDEAVIAEMAASDFGLSAGAFLVSVAYDAGEMVLAFRDGGDIVTVVLRADTMELISQLRVRAE